jgi:predicted nucleic acid-binding protein
LSRRYLLDTNIISNATKPTPSAHLLSWLAEQNDSDLFISAMSLAEVWRGILQLPAGKKRTSLETWFAGPDGPPQLFYGRVLALDEAAALIWARLMADGKAQGLALSPMDMLIAAVAEANGCIVATDNEADFATVPFINPLRPQSRLAPSKVE